MDWAVDNKSWCTLLKSRRGAAGRLVLLCSWEGSWQEGEKGGGGQDEGKSYRTYSVPHSDVP